MSSSRHSSPNSTEPSSPLADLQSSPELALVEDVDNPDEELNFSSDGEDFAAQPDRFNIPPFFYSYVAHMLCLPESFGPCISENWTLKR